MKEGLQKFLAVKTIFYVVAFGILAYGIFTKTEHKKTTDDDLPYQSGNNQVCFDKQCFDIEVADTPLEREYGLMNRTGMDLNKGMLFVFDEEKITSFWMKDTLIPLDIIWMDKEGKVVDLKTMQPCTTDTCPISTSAGSGLYILELNAGINQLIGLQKGSIAQFKKK